MMPVRIVILLEIIHLALCTMVFLWHPGIKEEAQHTYVQGTFTQTRCTWALALEIPEGQTCARQWNG